MTLPPEDDFEIAREPLHASDASPAAREQRRDLFGRRERRQVLEALGVVAALAVAVAITLISIRGAALETSAAPTATPHPASVVLASDVTFGTLTLNGKRLKGAPPLLVTLRAGRNTITLAAPPFRPVTCSIVWPGQQAEGDNCSTGTGGQPIISGQTEIPPLTLYMFVSADDLPPALASSARAVVSSMLSGVVLHTTVPGGDYFATKQDTQGMPVAERAPAAMRADLAFLLPEPSAPGSCMPGDFCMIPVEEFRQGLPLPQNVWSVSISVALRWTFTPPGRSPLVADPIVGNGPGVQLWLRYDGSGGWQVDMPPAGYGPIQTLNDQLSQSVCSAGTTLLSTIAGPAQQQFGMGTSGAEDHGVDGCDIQLLSNNPSGSSTPLGNVIWRFGTLLAADAGAHKLFPTLPLAPRDEVQAVGG